MMVVAGEKFQLHFKIKKVFIGMALRTDFELDGIIYRDCYLRIHKIRTQVSEYEYFETMSNSDSSKTAQVLTWKSRIETSANVYVWVDEMARQNRALPLKNFNFEFDFDLDSDRNIFQQAYDALKTTEAFSAAKDV